MSHEILEIGSPDTEILDTETIDGGTLLMDDLYRELIIDHYKNPQYRGHLDPNDIHFEDDNPLCGDHIEITLRVDESGKVTEGRFDGKGCAISQASADLLIESIIGKPVEDVKKLSKQDVLDLLGIELGPVRLKCALLSLKVLKAGVYGLGEASEELVN
jgi:nitrogen fixation NifU-like protein